MKDLQPDHPVERDVSHIRRRLRSLTSTIFIVSAIACVSPLDRFADYTGGQIVISGQVSTLSESNVVLVGRTSNLERMPEPILDAIVYLVSGDDQFVWSYEPDFESPGQYVAPNFSAEPGKSYKIRVELQNGRIYESSPEKIPLQTGNDSVWYEFNRSEYIDARGVVSQADFVNLFTKTSLPDAGEPLYLRWRVEEVYALSPTDFPDPFGNVPPTCYVYNHIDPQRIVLFNGAEVTTPSIENLRVASRILDPTFKERHYFTVYQASMSFESFHYWRKVNVVANQNGSIFDPPPARLRGNMRNVDDPSEEVHGHFQAVNEKFSRFYLVPDDLPYKMPVHCEYRPDREYFSYPSECRDCLSVKNSRYTRPSWF